MSKHAIVWLDHREAHVFHVSADAVAASIVAAPQHLVHRHPKTGGEPAEHPEDAKRYFHDVATALAESNDVLVVGPGTAKLHFLRYAHALDHAMERKIVGVESADHPTDRQLVAYAKQYFVGAR